MTELTEQELHCITRFLQGAIFGRNKNIFDCCAFCKYQCADIHSPVMPQYLNVTKKLYEMTGVDARPLCGGDSLPPFGYEEFWTHFNVSPVPYLKFLRGANEDIKAVFDKFFSLNWDEEKAQFLQKWGTRRDAQQIHSRCCQGNSNA